jgi:coenzyme F420 hydrogenase subunit beta
LQKIEKGSKRLFEEVVERGLCTGCGACLTGCPYLVTYEGRIVILDKCTVQDGDCYKHCPRTYTDMNAISEHIFGVPYGDEECGHALKIMMARSSGATIVKKAQDGGTVTALIATALEEGMIDAVVCTKMDENKVPRGVIAHNKEELFACAGSSYEASFLLEAYRNIPKDSKEKLAIVGVGCEMEAVAKMKIFQPQNSVNSDHIELTVGLFCGWALRPSSFHPYLEDICDPKQVVKFDIPHSPNYSFDMFTESEKKSVSLDDIRPFINPACQYCWDMTSEFSDISVGSAGSKYPGWNTVIVRTKRGQEVFQAAKKTGLIETTSLPEDRLSHLKMVALKRKKTALKNIIEKTGDKNNLLYIGNVSETITRMLLKD